MTAELDSDESDALSHLRETMFVPGFSLTREQLYIIAGDIREQRAGLVDLQSTKPDFPGLLDQLRSIENTMAALATLLIITPEKLDRVLSRLNKKDRN